MVVALAGFQPVDSDLVRRIKGSPAVGEAEPTLLLGAEISNGGEELEVQLQALDLSSKVWHPR